MDYFIYLLTLIGIYLILAQSLNLLLGLGGLFSLAHIATYGLGAYAAAILAVEYGVPLWGTLISALGLGMLGSLLIAVTASRLRKEYFAIATLAYHFIVVSLFVNWKSLTHGVLGIPGIPDPEVFGLKLDSPERFCFLVWIVCITCLGILYRYFKGIDARFLRAQAESELFASALGINCASVRLRALLFSGALAGVAGCLFAYFLRFIDPSSFALPEIILIIAMVIVGKPGSFWGCLAGTLMLVVLPEALRFIDYLQRFPSVLGPLRQIIYAIVLFLVVSIFKDKLFKTERRI